MFFFVKNVEKNCCSTSPTCICIYLTPLPASWNFCPVLPPPPSLNWKPSSDKITGGTEAFPPTWLASAEEITSLGHVSRKLDIITFLVNICFFSKTWFSGHYVKRKMIWQMGGELYKMLILIVFSSGWKLYDLPSWMKQNVGGLPNKSAINLQFTSSREAALAGNDMKHVHSNLYTVEFKFQSNLTWGNGISISIHGWWLLWLRAFTPLILSHFLWRQNKTGTWGAGCATIEKIPSYTSKTVPNIQA